MRLLPLGCRGCLYRVHSTSVQLPQLTIFKSEDKGTCSRPAVATMEPDFQPFTPFPAPDKSIALLVFRRKSISVDNFRGDKKAGHSADLRRVPLFWELSPPFEDGKDAPQKNLVVLHAFQDAPQEFYRIADPRERHEYKHQDQPVENGGLAYPERPVLLEKPANIVHFAPLFSPQNMQTAYAGKMRWGVIFLQNLQNSFFISFPPEPPPREEERKEVKRNDGQTAEVKHDIARTFYVHAEREAVDERNHVYSPRDTDIPCPCP